MFCCSLADVFDNQWPDGARPDLFALIRSTPDLDWLLLTKRPQNIERFLPPDWGAGYPNVWLGTTTENQEEFDRRWRILREIPARIRFVSYEPALGPLEIWPREDRLHWVICGGESGPGARPMDPDWARDLRDQCEFMLISFFLKQWGSYPSNPFGDTPLARSSDPTANGKGGALLDGRLHREFPA